MITQPFGQSGRTKWFWVQAQLIDYNFDGSASTYVAINTYGAKWIQTCEPILFHII